MRPHSRAIFIYWAMLIGTTDTVVGDVTLAMLLPITTMSRDDSGLNNRFCLAIAPPLASVTFHSAAPPFSKKYVKNFLDFP